jgi:F0F1-type ATP synthase assembly protein I
MHINYIALVITTIITIIVSALYYILLNKRVVAIRAQVAKQTKVKNTDIRTTMTPNKLIVEFVRTFITGLVIAYAVLLLGTDTFGGSLVLGVWLWIGFPAVLLTGSVIHEHFPPKLAAIHAGDWLIKTLLFSVILTLWH